MSREMNYLTMEELKQTMKKTGLYADYIRMDTTWKKRFEDYMTGRKTMPLTYDPFFKCIFNPDVHPEWLSNLLSAIIGESVTVEDVLPFENTAVSVDSLLVMDIVVRLGDGSLANVEIQKIPYQFTAERISCYSSDLLLREYTRLKQNKNFLYSDLKKVYTIVLYEKTSTAFKNEKLQGEYRHHGKTKFDTNLELELLQEYFLISLDVFCEKRYTEYEKLSYKDDLSGWMSVLTAETKEDVEQTIREYPWSEAVFQEMSEYIKKPEEVMLMFSEALKIADKNTVKYMMDELQDKLNQSEEECRQEQVLQKQEEEKRKQAEESLQQSKEHERRLEEEIAKLRAQLDNK